MGGWYCNLYTNTKKLILKSVWILIFHWLYDQNTATPEPIFEKKTFLSTKKWMVFWTNELTNFRIIKNCSFLQILWHQFIHFPLYNKYFFQKCLFLGYKLRGTAKIYIVKQNFLIFLVGKFWQNHWDLFLLLQNVKT